MARTTLLLVAVEVLLEHTAVVEHILLVLAAVLVDLMLAAAMVVMDMLNHILELLVEKTLAVVVAGADTPVTRAALRIATTEYIKDLLVVPVLSSLHILPK